VPVAKEIASVAGSFAMTRSNVHPWLMGCGTTQGLFPTYLFSRSLAH